MNARQPGGTHEPRPGRGGASLDKEEKNTCRAQIHIERRLNSRPSETQEEGARWGFYSEKGEFGLISAGVSRSQLCSQ